MSKGVRIGSAEQRDVVTIADERLFHYISDEELIMLTTSDNGPAGVVFTTAIGVFFGAVQPAFTVAAQGLPTSWADMVPLALTFASLIVAVLAGFEWRRRTQQMISLKERIRARPKVPVGTVPDFAALDYVAEK